MIRLHHHDIKVARQIGSILRECAAMGQTVFELAPKSRAAEEYQALIERVLRG